MQCWNTPPAPCAGVHINPPGTARATLTHGTDQVPGKATPPAPPTDTKWLDVKREHGRREWPSVQLSTACTCPGLKSSDMQTLWTPLGQPRLLKPTKADPRNPKRPNSGFPWYNPWHPLNHTNISQTLKCLELEQGAITPILPTSPRRSVPDVQSLLRII